jgi:glycosyltransferase involved in cell wall biosynthesis
LPAETEPENPQPDPPHFASGPVFQIVNFRMRIAFISYEFPPDTAVGGIGTYVYQATALLAGRGHEVEVFAGSGTREGTVVQGKVTVHLIRDTKRRSFAQAVAGVFLQRHQQAPFDVLESPEYRFEGLEAARLCPEVPLVVKLHTPNILLCELAGGVPPPTLANTLKEYGQQLRALAGAVRHRRSLPRWHWCRHVEQAVQEADDAERTLTQKADVVVSPSASLLEMMAVRWNLDRTKLLHVPNPYVAPARLLAVPFDTSTNVISFFGRVETRKGVADLAAAIPQVLAQFPEAKFRFVGKITTAPDGRDYKTYIQEVVGKWRDNLEFIGHQPMEKVHEYFGRTDICVFPSRWENFPNVCLEAMAAGRGVIGSSAGGMAEMLDGGKAGVLVRPQAPDEIAAAILRLLRNPAERMRFGELARQRVLSEYNNDRIGALLEQSYDFAIKRHLPVKSRLAGKSS